MKEEAHKWDMPYPWAILIFRDITMLKKKKKKVLNSLPECLALNYFNLSIRLVKKRYFCQVMFKKAFVMLVII